MLRAHTSLHCACIHLILCIRMLSPQRLVLLLIQFKRDCCVCMLFPQDINLPGCLLPQVLAGAFPSLQRLVLRGCAIDDQNDSYAGLSLVIKFPFLQHLELNNKGNGCCQWLLNLAQSLQLLPSLNSLSIRWSSCEDIKEYNCSDAGRNAFAAVASKLTHLALTIDFESEAQPMLVSLAQHTQLRSLSIIDGLAHRPVLQHWAAISTCPTPLH